MINNLEKIKLILWDFDDTLCVHSDHHSTEDKFNTAYNVDVLLKNDVYKTCSDNLQIKAFMHFAKEKGIRQGLISSTTSCIHMKNKENWVNEHYGISLENYCVSQPEMKLGIMIALAKANHYKNEEILLVDDSLDNLERGCDNGFQACTPLEIVNYITQYERFTLVKKGSICTWDIIKAKDIIQCVIKNIDDSNKVEVIDLLESVDKRLASVLGKLIEK